MNDILKVYNIKDTETLFYLSKFKEYFPRHYDNLILLLELSHYDNKFKLILNTYSILLTYIPSRIVLYEIYTKDNTDRKNYVCEYADRDIATYLNKVSYYRLEYLRGKELVINPILTFLGPIINFHEFEDSYRKNNKNVKQNSLFMDDLISESIYETLYKTSSATYNSKNPNYYNEESEFLGIPHMFSFTKDESDIPISRLVDDIMYSFFLHIISNQNEVMVDSFGSCHGREDIFRSMMSLLIKENESLDYLNKKLSEKIANKHVASKLLTMIKE